MYSGTVYCACISKMNECNHINLEIKVPFFTRIRQRDSHGYIGLPKQRNPSITMKSLFPLSKPKLFMIYKYRDIIFLRFRSSHISIIILNAQ